MLDSRRVTAWRARGARGLRRRRLQGMQSPGCDQPQAAVDFEIAWSKIQRIGFRVVVQLVVVVCISFLATEGCLTASDIEL